MVNIRDLAKIAGVSVATVSRVLNNHPYVSDEKRKAVIKAIKETNYRQNINAVHLSKGQTHLIGVVLAYTNHPYFGMLLNGIAEKALEKNYKLVLFHTNFKKERELEALRMLEYKQIDALIIISRANSWDVINEYAQYGKIVVYESTKNKAVSATYVNHYQIFLDALEYLYDKGHTKIGYCIQRKTGPSSNKRKAAYKDFLKKHQLPCRKEYAFEGISFLEDGEKVLKEISQMDSPPTALVVTSDQAAAGIMVSSQKYGISVPDDLAIIGFDNEPIARMMDITTIEIPFVKIGKLLFQQAVDAGVPERYELSVRLIERGTV